MTQMIQTTQKTMHNQTLQKWATLSNTVTRYSLSQTLMSNALHYKASKRFRYIYYICRWCCGGGGGGFVIIFGRFGGVRANLRLLRGGYCVIFLLARLIFRPPPPPPPLLIIIAQSLKVGEPARSLFSVKNQTKKLCQILDIKPARF